MIFIKILLLLTVGGAFNVCNSYRILAIYPMPIKSHFIFINQLLTNLARKGHVVDLISAIPLKNNVYPNYKQIMTLPHKRHLMLNYSNNFEILQNFHMNLSFVGSVSVQLCESIGVPEFQNLIRNPPTDPPYDLVISQIFTTHCFLTPGYLWNIPNVLLSTTSFYPWMHDMIGNPENIAISPNNVYPIAGKNSFWYRMYNFHLFYLSKLSYLYFSRQQDQILKKYFNLNDSSLRDLKKSASLVLTNTHFTISGALPTTNALIEVGGLHIQPQSSDLSEFPDLKKWLDEGTNGVIYFSFGSILYIDMMPEEIINIVFKTLGSLSSIRVLIRIHEPKNLHIKIPSNFYSMPWMPQAKIFQHPNIKMFITHGGALGTFEAIYYGIPMVCMPFIVDQQTNSKNYVNKKVAIFVDIFSLTEREFSNAVNEVLSNPIYRENAMKLSKLFQDRPQSAMDTAIFWIEYITRNGKDTLRSPVMDLTWWQVSLLDVCLVSIIMFIVLIFIARIVTMLFIKLLLKLIRQKSCNSKMMNKKKN